jgi:hypothetical protein
MQLIGIQYKMAMTINDIIPKNHIDARNLWFGLHKTAHFWDDLIDKDNKNEDVHSVLWFLLAELPINAFYVKNFSVLHPAITHACMTFIASAKLEKNKERLDISHVLRYELGAVLLHIALIIHGKQFVMDYGDEMYKLIVDDNLEDYLKEQENKS